MTRLGFGGLRYAKAVVHQSGRQAQRHVRPAKSLGLHIPVVES